MKEIKFVTRADDAGSSHSANAAIMKVIKAGVIKNVSVMAPGNFVEEAAYFFSGRKDICFGMHATINAEWDKVKWGPVSELNRASGLVDENGKFLSSTNLFLETKPDVECILKEYDAQLDKLCRNGFSIKYVDSHMFPERHIPGFDEALAAWAVKKGLLDHMYFYNLPQGWERIIKDMKQIVPIFREMPDGQYFFVAHPAFDSEEMRQTGNRHESGETVARGRNTEARLFGNPLTLRLLKLAGVTPLRYDEAVLGRRSTVEDICNILHF